MAEKDRTESLASHPLVGDYSRSCGLPPNCRSANGEQVVVLASISVDQTELCDFESPALARDPYWLARGESQGSKSGLRPHSPW